MSLVLVHSARQLITLHGTPGPRCGPAANQLHIINDGAVLIENGVIREVGPTRRLENLSSARNAQDISAAGRVVMPGFVDCHTHLISGPSLLGEDGRSLFRQGIADGRVVLDNMAYVRDMSAKRLAADAAVVLQGCLRHGTTTLEAKSGYGLNLSAELKILRVLTALGDLRMTVVPTLSALAVPPDSGRSAAEHIDWISKELLPAVHRRGCARFVDAMCDRGAFSAAEIRPLLSSAAQLGLPVKLSLCAFGPCDGAALAREFPLTSADHLDYIDDSGIEQLAGTGAIAVLAPSAAFFLGHRYAPARSLIERGVPVALASNYSRVTSPTYNMQMALFLACHEMHMTPAEAITAATLNSAHAVKAGRRVGSLETGKVADLIILSVGDYRELAYEFGINLVGMTIKQGVVIGDKAGSKWPVPS